MSESMANLPINALSVTVFLIHGEDLEYINRGKLMGNNSYDNAITDKQMSEQCMCGHLRGEHAPSFDGEQCYYDQCLCKGFIEA